MNASWIPTPIKETGRSAAWWLGLAIVLAGLVALPWTRAAQLKTPPPLPLLVRNQPLKIEPRYDAPQVVTDEQLAAVLHKLRPQLREPQPKISVLDHALRCWGADAVFPESHCLSGPEMRQLLLDHRMYVQYWGQAAPPLLFQEEYGLGVRTQQGASTASHVDHTLATLAEIGTPLDQQVHTPDGRAQVRDMFVSAVRSFSLNQREYEWTALVLALYSPNSQPWLSKEGQWITFDLLAERIMRQEFDEGVCYGNHRLYTLAVLLRVDEGHLILQPVTADKVRDHLQEATARLTRVQHGEGWWDANWADGQALPAQQNRGSRSRRLLVTGHALEWWAIAPQEVLPPREVVIRAGQWLVRQIEQLDAQAVEENYTFLSHVGRALALWRGKLPAEVLSGN